MIIYLIGQKGIPAISGGVERHVEDLAIGLVKAGHEVYAYTRPHYSDKVLKEFRGVKLISLPSVATKNLDAITHTFRACLDIRKRQVDLIHFHSIGPSSLIWLVKLLKPGVPVIATIHSKCYLHQKWSLFARLYLRLSEYLTCKFADKVITVSKDSTAYIKEKYKINPIYIPNGTYINPARELDVIRKWDLTKDSYILAVSRFIRVKGLHHLIKAFGLVKTDKKLVIVGNGILKGDTYCDEVIALASQNKNILLVGSQPYENVAELYDNAYLTVQPSEFEGLSVVLLEAMAHKTPVLASRIPSNKEACGDIAYYFASKDYEDLAKKLEYMISHEKEIKTKGAKGLDRVKKLFSWDSIIKQTLQIYTNQIKKN